VSLLEPTTLRGLGQAKEDGDVVRAASRDKRNEHHDHHLGALGCEST